MSNLARDGLVLRDNAAQRDVFAISDSGSLDGTMCTTPCLKGMYEPWNSQVTREGVVVNHWQEGVKSFEFDGAGGYTVETLSDTGQYVGSMFDVNSIGQIHAPVNYAAVYSDGTEETMLSGNGQSSGHISFADIDDDGDGVATIQLSTFGSSAGETRDVSGHPPLTFEISNSSVYGNQDTFNWHDWRLFR